jgi:subtilisin family serine protease
MYQKKKFKKISSILASVLTTGALITASIPFNVLASDTASSLGMTDVKDVLANLTDEQLEAIKKLEVAPGFVISPEINQTTSREIEVIVEFKQAPAQVEIMKNAVNGKTISNDTAYQKVDESHKKFKEELTKLQQKKDLKKNFDSAKVTREFKNIFNGVAMTLPANTIEDLIRTGLVKRVWKNHEVKLDLPKTNTSLTIEPTMADSIPQIGVDKLHEENITGKGIKVGVLDTGIDYNHPDLTQSYKGYRSQGGLNPEQVDPNSIKGWDFVDNDADPMETTYKDWQATEYPEYLENSYYTSHGTHVSGTIAGKKKNEVDYAVKGVAPDVDLYAYRVLGPYGSGDTSNIIAAIDKAVTDGMDVINLSLGSSINDPLDPSSIALNNAMLAGVVAVVSAGNSGPGAGTLGSPGASALAITVGASDSAQKIPTIGLEAGEIKIDSMKLLAKNFKDDLNLLTDLSLPIIYSGLGYESDFAGKDVSGKVVLLERGEISFDEKVKNAAKAGAKSVIVYNNVDGEIPAYLGEGKEYIPAFRLTKSDGEVLQQKLAQGELTVTFGQISEIKTNGDHLADFSSRGPAFKTDDIKPDVVAPGVSIFSTVPEYINSPEEGEEYSTAYGRMSGTSMASPHTAGVAALILQNHPDYSPFDVKAALMNTSNDLHEEYSVYEVGAGRIDAYQAVHANTSIKVMDKTETIQNSELVEIEEITGSIMYGSQYQLDNQPISDTRKVIIANNSKTEKKEYKIEIEFLSTSVGAKDAEKNHVILNVPSSVSIDPDSTFELNSEITVPHGAEFGRYEGYIHIMNPANMEEMYQVPFAFRYSDRGISYVDLWRDAMATDASQFHGSMAGPFSGLTFKFNSPMKRIDAIVKDRATGRAIGLFGTFDASGIYPNIDYFMFIGMAGQVYPFTGDPNRPVGDRMIELPEGDYEYEWIAYDEDGNTYSRVDSIVIDNTPPEIIFNDFQPGVYEVNDSMFTDEDGHHALWVHGKVYDSTIDILKEKGLKNQLGEPYDQTDNTILYYQNSSWPTGYLETIQPNGDFKFGVLPEEINEPLSLRIFGYDTATAGNIAQFKDYTFVKEGTEYGTFDYNKDVVRLGDKITLTLNLNNVKQLVSGEFEIPYWKSNYEFIDVKPNEKFVQYTESHGLNVKLAQPTFREEYFEKFVKVGASLEGNEFKGLDGDTPFLDVTFEIKNDEYYQEVATFMAYQLMYKKLGGNEEVTVPIFHDELFTFIPKHTVALGYIKPEAFLVPYEGWLPNMNYTELGAKVYAISSNGTRFDGVIDEHGWFEIHDIPVSDKEYEIFVEMPGHLKSKLSTNMAKMKNGELIGVYHNVYMDDNLAGDVNQDKVIDIEDLIFAVKFYGAKNVSVKKGDLNQDGVVNEIDIRFIEKNFLRKGPDANPNQKVFESKGKDSLESLLKSIGLQPLK